ncbi:4-(cytidine 5'-diphospho)-2-C-methyl-D-erythritol kinase [bacterium endosymbiont of Pedicinus badii]|uniref:4-(cytidine 5'-diphospho)-2-C-methyl-D-erythritol kinase n=1 Tax=bacterium endosymbiont of Pedicinus badii TaxID=1719126 RepID=UPI0009BC3863|nr:4-(cytidine 5'-diphospho)-2-C-methyl-D-erythritol kinase [bacterium endosymbiont of Pedicinus badii]OQM34381.1 hypothetical protein AOQ89_00615 [bacterium endosymbiont of Pedicinus badii]
MNIIWPCPAKINLFLKILNKRKDGFYNIKTIFQIINYCDYIKFFVNKSKKIKIINPIFGIKNKNNLITVAAKLLQKYHYKKYGILPGVNIKIVKKNIPIGSGMGGGSSNAATTLVALNILWKCNIKIKKLLEIAQKVGSDVPIFVRGFSSYAEGRGEKLKKINLFENWYVIAIPPIRISTKEAFFLFEKNTTKKETIEKIFSNDLETVIIKKFQILKKYIFWLSKFAPSSITGSGSCVFSAFNKKKEAKKVLSKIPKWMDCILVKGINFSPLKKVQEIVKKILSVCN